MKNLICSVMILSGVCVAQAADVQAELRVVTSRALRVAAIRETSSMAQWYVIQQAFCTGLSDNLKKADCKAMPVEMIPASTSTVAEELARGEFDAVLVVGERLPSDLREAGFYSVRAVSEVGVPVRVFHLVIRSDDAAAVRALTTAFEKTTSSASFNEVIANISSLRVVADARR